jgi:hypothetical protein
MTLGSAMASRAIGDVARRGLASEWGGPEPAAVRDAMQGVAIERQAARRVAVRKP